MGVVTELTLYCDGCGEEYGTGRDVLVLRAQSWEDGWQYTFGWDGSFRFLDACPGCDIEEIVDEARDETGFEVRSVHC